MDLKRLGVELVDGDSQAIMASLIIQPTLQKKIKVAEMKDTEQMEIVKKVRSEQQLDFNVSKDGVLRFQARLCVPNNAGIKKTILEEAHRSLCTVHLGNTKMWKWEHISMDFVSGLPSAVNKQNAIWSPKSGLTSWAVHCLSTWVNASCICKGPGPSIANVGLVVGPSTECLG
ncbi:uncharacterized protein LOC131158699 [Malania oleifera]|uniref:uncharacterized protein LOC131158699 n=1 Tax=Malania oleifera TaxID=397392 RepID=UPI0025ADF08E|nr:uncharacterized protein LOC131158699 [Malania oleifera]